MCAVGVRQANSSVAVYPQVSCGGERKIAQGLNKVVNRLPGLSNAAMVFVTGQNYKSLQDVEPILNRLTQQYSKKYNLSKIPGFVSKMNAPQNILIRAKLIISSDHSPLCFLPMNLASKRLFFMYDAHRDGHALFEKDGLLMTSSESGNTHGAWHGKFIIDQYAHGHKPAKIVLVNNQDIDRGENELTSILLKQGDAELGPGCKPIPPGDKTYTSIKAYLDNYPMNSLTSFVQKNFNREPFTTLFHQGDHCSDRTIIHLDTCFDGFPNDASQYATTNLGPEIRGQMMKHFDYLTYVLEKMGKEQCDFSNTVFNFHETEFFYRESDGPGAAEAVQELFDISVLSKQYIEMAHLKVNNPDDQESYQIVMNQIKMWIQERWQKSDKKDQYATPDSFFEKCDEMVAKSTGRLKIKQEKEAENKRKLELCNLRSLNLNKRRCA